jgi:hypothetical protein
MFTGEIEWSGLYGYYPLYTQPEMGNHVFIHTLPKPPGYGCWVPSGNVGPDWRSKKYDDLPNARKDENGFFHSTRTKLITLKVQYTP